MNVCGRSLVFALAVGWGPTLAGPLAAAVAPPANPAPAARVPAAGRPPVAPEQATFARDIRPLLEKYCYECHGKGGKEDEGEFHLAEYQDAAGIVRDGKKWEEALAHVRNRQMPPENAAVQPAAPERELLAGWIDRQLFKADPQDPDPGRVIIHRLNRTEYNLSIRDLLGVDYHPADDFPADDSGHGFDNISDVLSLPPMLLAKYVGAAEKALELAVPTQQLASATWHFPANQAQVGFNDLGDRGDGWVQILSLFEGDVAVELDVPVTGEYRVSFQAFGQDHDGNIYGASGVIPNTPPETPVLSLFEGGTAVREFKIEAVESAPATYQGTLSLVAGRQRVRLVMRRHRGGEQERVVDTMARYVGRQSNAITWVKWIRIEGPVLGAVTRVPAASLAATGPGVNTADGARVLTDTGSVALKFNVAKEGDYLLRAYADATQAGPEAARMTVGVNAEFAATVDVLAPSAYQQFNDPQTRRPWTAPADHLVAVPQMHEFKAHLTPGEKTLTAAFLNPQADPENPNPNLRARTLTVRSLEVVSLAEPAPVPPVSAVMQEYFGQAVTPQNQATAARALLTRFALRAWRRPPEREEVDRLMGLFAAAARDAGSFAAAVKLPLMAVLVSPHFLFRAEFPQPDPPAAGSGAPARAASLGVPVGEFTLASRLSYFLWSSVPDDELLDLAGKNQLRKNFAAQVARMLASPKARALVDNFAGQWLQFRALAGFEPDRTLFPRFSPGLRADMEQATARFFEHILRENRSVMEFLTADYTFVNGRLADFYGLPGVTGDAFRQVSLAGTPRQGVLSQGSFLLLTSNPSRTSPVKRGRFVLDNILGTPVPAPPPGVVVNLDAPEQAGLTVRQRIDLHRSDPRCASCHAMMDPIGLGFENFAGVGAWRDREAEGDKEVSVNAAGKLATGETFSGAKALIGILATGHRTEYYRNLAQKMLTFALGRGIEAHGSDRLAVDRIVQKIEGDDRFASLVLAVTESVPFQQMRRPAPLSP